jgi:sugar/nucleoside kinase (ribokinase family)
MGFIDAAKLANRAASLLVSSFGARIPRPAAQALLS